MKAVKSTRGVAQALYFLGIDGGGSRTTAWLEAGSGRVLAQAQAGPSNPVKAGLELATRELLRAARGALRDAHLTRVRLEAVCAGVAGVDRVAIHRNLLSTLERGLRAKHYLLTTDAAIILEAALGGSPGVIVISGTGSIGYSRDELGNTQRTGGWGSVFDDPGSGYDLGHRAIAAALRGFDGRGPKTRLGEMICRALAIKAIPEVVSLSLAPNQIAGLFPLVLQAAERGDEVARQLCRGAGEELAAMAIALLNRAGGGENLRVVCAGGVFRASPSIRRGFAMRVRQAAPGAKIALLQHEPVEGALALARAQARRAELG